MNPTDPTKVDPMAPAAGVPGATPTAPTTTPEPTVVPEAPAIAPMGEEPAATIPGEEKPEETGGMPPTAPPMPAA